MSPFGRRQMRPPQRRSTRRMRPAFGQRSGTKLRLLMGLAIGGFALISFLKSAEYNPVTGEKIFTAGLTEKQEIRLGLEAAPHMIQQHGGQHPDLELQAIVDRVGRRVWHSSPARDTEWVFDFHLLDDPDTINAFALPGGQVFITYALFNQLQSEGQLAGVLGHEIGHVVARHGAQRMAKQKFTSGLINAVMAASGSTQSGQFAQMIGQMVNMKYGRGDELESDKLGVQFVAKAGYDPRAMIGVMKILESASGTSQPEFFSTHPNPKNRVGEIQRAIAELFPTGAPDNLEP